MRTKVVFSGGAVLAAVAVVIGVFVSRDGPISANVYYYCWECAATADGLGCVQVQYDSPDHGGTQECPEGTFANEGLCSLACYDPSGASSSSASSASSVERSSSSALPVPSSSSAPMSSSASSREINVVLGNVELPVELFYGIVAAIFVSIVAFLIYARRSFFRK